VGEHRHPVRSDVVGDDLGEGRGEGEADGGGGPEHRRAPPARAAQRERHRDAGEDRARHADDDPVGGRRGLGPAPGCAQVQKAGQAEGSRQGGPATRAPPRRSGTHTASSTTRKSSSVVRRGCTWVSRPKCRATAWSKKEATMKPNPASQTPRRSAWVSSDSLSVASSGASSRPIRCRTLVSALASAAPSAKEVHHGNVDSTAPGAKGQRPPGRCCNSATGIAPHVDSRVCLGG